MRAVRRSAGNIEVVNVPLPDRDGVRVKIRASGICGSDLAMLSAPGDSFILGHEFSGITDDGTPVAIEPLVPCGSCGACARGDYSLCSSLSVIGVDQDGGMAEEIIVPARCLVPLPSLQVARDACLVEPLAVAVRGLGMAGLVGGQSVAVVGGGSIGLCAVAAARARGCDVALFARHAAQRSAGERLGAKSADGPFDIVVDATGAASGVNQSIGLARTEGTILLLGVYWNGLEIDAMGWVAKQLRIVASVLYAHGAIGRDVDTAAALLARDPEIGQALISHRFGLDDASEAFRCAMDRASGAIKVVLEN